MFGIEDLLAPIISAVVGGVGSGIAGSSGPGQPGAPSQADYQTALNQAQAAYLPTQRAVAAAAQQGKKVSDALNLKSNSMTLQQLRELSGKLRHQDRTDPTVAAQFKVVSQYITAAKQNGGKVDVWQDPTGSLIPTQVATADFTGYGAGQVQAETARQYADMQQQLGEKYGVQFAEEAAREAREADPMGYAARQKMAELIEAEGQRPLNQPVADLLQKQVGEQLNAGKGLDNMEKDVLDRAVADSLASRGQTASGDFAQPLTTGLEGEARRQAGVQKATGFLSSGSTPEDIEYRRREQQMANEAALVNGQSPVSQFQNLSAPGPVPTYTGQPLPTMQPNPGAANAFALANWNTSMNQAENTANPWMQGISSLLKAGGAAAPMFA